MPESAEIVIVGSGTAGLSALRQVRRHTEDVLVVNHRGWGTTCATVGCMPSKALIEAADAYHRRGCFAEFGIRGAEALRVEIPAVLARVRRLRDDFAKGPESVRDDLGERAIDGFARLRGPGRIEVAGRQIEARRIILATGSHPIVPGPWEAFGDRILTSDTLFEQEDLPGRIAVVGLGPVGLELAQAIARLGVQVAGFDGGDTIGRISDPEIMEAARGSVGAEMTLALGADAQIEEAEGGALRVTAGETRFTADAVLAALGRAPNVAGLGLETLGVPLDERGLPEVDPASLRIGDLPVWMVGDANGDRPILHEAADEGYIAGCGATSEGPVGFRRRTAMSVVFTEPGIAQVGRSARELGDEQIVTGRADFSRQGRARTAGRAAGLLHVYAARDGRLLGAEMCAPAADHLAHLLALAVESASTVGDMLAMPFYHPTLEEGLRSALRDAARQLPGERGPDLARCPEIGIDALD